MSAYLNILSPSAGTVGETFTVSGTAGVTGVEAGTKLTVSSITVQFGAGGQSVKATPNAVGAWTCSGSVSSNAISGGPIVISAGGTVTYAPPDQTGEIQYQTDNVSQSVTVTLQSPAPILSVSPPLPSVTVSSLPITVTGTATSPSVVGHITSVQYALSSAARVSASNDAVGDWQSWSASINLSVGTTTLVFFATDSHGVSSTSGTYTVVVEEPIENIPANQKFEPSNYLRELLTFAKDHVLDPGTSPPTGPTAQLLSQQFFQPFDALTVVRGSNDPAYLQANALLHPARIAIEVLRQYMKAATPPIAVPADTDQRYRLLAYQAFLRQTGTSYEELRLARVAAPTTRTALAARIGIQAGTSRPDNLDQITLLSTAITDSALETLFGYRSTAPADPLAPAAGQPAFLLWQLAALRGVWQNADSQARDAAAASLPLIDPDILNAANFTSQTRANPAFALWTARASWVNTTLAQITQDGAAQTVPLTLFNQLVSKYVGIVDVAALAATDANGGDVSASLAPLFLDLAAFRFLALCLQLLSAGTLLDSEWQDIFSILLQTQKRQQASQWRTQETQAGLILEPAQFQANVGGPSPDIPAWRGSSQMYADWQRTLEGRLAQSQTLQGNLALAVTSAESQTLPALRDALLQSIGQQQSPVEAQNATAERLSRQLQIDFLTNVGPATTRVNQAIDTLQGILFSVRAGSITSSGALWALNYSASPAFDDAWVWMGSFNPWVAASKVFAYPQNQLSPSLYVTDGTFLTPQRAFLSLISGLRNQTKFLPDDARTAATNYLTGANLDSTWLTLLGPQLTDMSSDQDLLKRQAALKATFSPSTVFTSTGKDYELFEALWLVPMAIGQRLQGGRQYFAALGWFRTVYAYNLPQADRAIFYPLTLEANVITVEAAYARDPLWLTTRLNPHIFVQPLSSGSTFVGRKNPYTSSTVLSIVQCMLAYADLLFTNSSTESISEARSLYETVVDLTQSPPDASTPSDPSTPDPNDPYPPNPIWPPLLSHAQSNLAKIRNGMNIAGALLTTGSATVFLPSQYPYSVLVNRAKSWVSIAQQVEASYLSALEQFDAAAYGELQVNNDLQVMAASLTLSQLKVTDAVDGVTAAQLQQNKASYQYGYYGQLISNGLSSYELAGLGAMATAVAADALSWWGVKAFSPGSVVAATASAAAQLSDTWASYERRDDEWHFQQNLAGQDVQIAGQQIVVAQDQQAIAVQEQIIAGVQFSNAVEVSDFLANKFTNAELFDWMSGVLGQVYAYFLEQSTAIAQLAEAQLAFERQTPPSGYIRSDYWQDTSDSSDGTNRKGLTGAEQLLEDIDQLDEYAFESDVRTLHLTQTLSVSQIAALEIQQFRETGLLVFATPMSLFDQDFPGHYLRLIQSVQISIIALVPPVQGVRATLSASGLSRVVVPTDYQFQSVTLGRAPESFSFTSPLNASGLFDEETDASGLLLPFQGMGVDTVWQLELPKAANPFDFRTIADVQLTIKYTALNSFDYREQVIRSLDSTFSGDQMFSIRNDFPDAWYLLNNPQTVADSASQMKVTLTADSADFQPNIDALAVQQISLYCLRQDGVTQELNLLSLSHTPPDGQKTISTGAVKTTAGIAGTRRPAGAPWQGMIGENPVGDWTLQFENTDPVRALFTNGSIQDIALVLTVNGMAPAWP